MPAWQIALLAPFFLLITTYLAFKGLAWRFGAKIGYLGGFVLYWVVWGLIFPLVLLGPQALLARFSAISPFGDPWWLGAICVLAPPLIALVNVFPRLLPNATTRLILFSALLAVVNGTLEEVLWRGVFTSLFINVWLGILYPSLFFALWQFVPQSLFPHRGPGGRTELAMRAAILGLLWGWAASHTGTILWVALAHIVVDFSALGWRMYFPDQGSRPEGFSETLRV